MEDATAPSGVQFLHIPNTQMYPGFQDWMAGAVAVADFNRDGWPDIYWSSGGGNPGNPIPDKLFINNGNGTFTDRAAEWGIAIVHAAMGACVGDFDGDGWPDLFLTSFGNAGNNQGQVGKNKLWRNSGNGTFTEMAELALVHMNAAVIPSGYGCSFGDYDLDGHLDLMVCSWVLSANGTRLYRNNGDGTFTDVTGTAVVIPPTYGFQSTFADMDGDGWPDLLIAADFKTSRYYRNNGDGTFTDVTVASGTGLDENGMGQCVGDFDRDGRLDWYVTSIYQDVPTPVSGRGNKLYMNTGGVGVHQYVEVAKDVGVEDGGWGWGASAVDLDHDGWLDIVTVNGRPGSPEHSNEQEYLFYNQGGAASFVEIAVPAGMISSLEGKASLTLDYDGDGWMDVLIGNNGNFSGVSSPGALNKLFRNKTSAIADGRWLHLTFETTDNPRIAPMGFGARVTAKVGQKQYVHFMDSGPSFLGTSEICAHFGLGSALTVDELRIDWPRGYVTTMQNVPTNQRMVIHAPGLCDANGDGLVDGADLGALLGIWGPVGVSSVRWADFNNDGEVDGQDLGIMLGAWTGE